MRYKPSNMYYKLCNKNSLYVRKKYRAERKNYLPEKKISTEAASAWR